MPAPFDLECKFELEHRTAVVPDFNRHLVAAVPWGPDGISGHIGKRARRLFLHLLYGCEFQTFLIRENLVTLSDVKVIPSHQTRTTPTSNCFFRKTGHSN